MAPRLTNLQNHTAGLSAEDDRLIRGVSQPLVTAMHTAGGILPGPTGYMGSVTLLSSTQIQVDPFRANVLGTQSAAQGDYPVVNDATITRSIDPQDATLARIDLLVTRVRDTAYTPNEGEDDVLTEVIPGTPAQLDPLAPELPPNSLLHGTITVPVVGQPVYFTPNPRVMQSPSVGRNWGYVDGTPSAPLPLEADGLVIGDYCWFEPWQCMMIRSYRHNTEGSAAIWAQLTDAYTNSALGGIKGFTSRLTSEFTPPDGFRVRDSSLDRLYISKGNLTDWDLVGGGLGNVISEGLTAAVGWTIVGGFVRSLGNGMALASLTVAKAGSALSVPATGDVATTLVATLPPGFGAAGTYYTLQSGGAGRMLSGAVTGNREVFITSMAPGANVNVGDQLSFFGTFFLADPLAV